MLTQQQVEGMRVPPQKFRSAMADELHEACEGGESRPVEEGDENGYEVAIWLQMCPLNPATGKPEYTWLKAILGNEKFYLVQKAFRFEPSEDQIRQWTQYLKDSFLCEMHSLDHPCPKFELPE